MRNEEMANAQSDQVLTVSLDYAGFERAWQ